MSADENKIKFITCFISILSFFLFVPTVQNLFSDFPISIWDRNPRQLALELAASCQSPDNAAQYKISIDKSNPNNPPERCTISFYSICRRCNNFTGSVSILHCRPEKSYFAGVHGEAPSWNGEYKPHLNTHLVRLQKKLDAMSYRNQRSMDSLDTEIQVLEAQYAAADCHEKNKLHEKIDALNNELLLKQLGMERGAALDKLKMSLSFALDKL